MPMHTYYLPFLIALTNNPGNELLSGGASNNDNQQVLEVAREFAACSGKYAALADYAIEKNQRKRVIETYEGISGGARVASAYLYHSVKNESNEIKEYYRYIDPVADKKKKQLGTKLTDPSIPFKELVAVEMARCKELNPLQNQIINKLREDHFTGNRQKQ